MMTKKQGTAIFSAIIIWNFMPLKKMYDGSKKPGGFQKNHATSWKRSNDCHLSVWAVRKPDKKAFCLISWPGKRNHSEPLCCLKQRLQVTKRKVLWNSIQYLITNGMRLVKWAPNHFNINAQTEEQKMKTSSYFGRETNKNLQNAQNLMIVVHWKDANSKFWITKSPKMKKKKKKGRWEKTTKPQSQQMWMTKIELSNDSNVCQNEKWASHSKTKTEWCCHRISGMNGQQEKICHDHG